MEPRGEAVFVVENNLTSTGTFEVMKVAILAISRRAFGE